jgi:hypothetical protein
LACYKCLAKSGWRYIGYLSAVGTPAAKSSSQWEARRVPEEMPLTMLTNKKQGKLRLRDATNIIKPT